MKFRETYSSYNIGNDAVRHIDTGAIVLLLFKNSINWSLNSYNLVRIRWNFMEL